MADISSIKTPNGVTYTLKDSTARTHISNKSNPHGVTKSQIGLGNVANLDQSKAINGIQRSGMTFTATRLDGTTFTFDQQDEGASSMTNAQIDAIADVSGIKDDDKAITISQIDAITV